jgi:hypothetical protein
MAGLVPAIQVFSGEDLQDVDARHKAEHDESYQSSLIVTRHCEERSDEAIQGPRRKDWIASLRSQ